MLHRICGVSAAASCLIAVFPLLRSLRPPRRRRCFWRCLITSTACSALSGRARFSTWPLVRLTASAVVLFPNQTLLLGRSWLSGECSVIHAFLGQNTLMGCAL